MWNLTNPDRQHEKEWRLPCLGDELLRRGENVMDKQTRDDVLLEDQEKTEGECVKIMKLMIG